MIDQEKVIKGLQCIIDGTVRCESCGYAIDKHGHHSCQQECARDAIALLKNQPEIVRCKDCCRRLTTVAKNTATIIYLCSNSFDRVTPDWFCPNGKRR